MYTTNKKCPNETRNHSGLCKSYMVYCHSQGIVTGFDGATNGTWVAQLSAGYGCISETKFINTHSTPLSIDEDFQSTRCEGAVSEWSSSNPQVTISWSYKEINNIDAYTISTVYRRWKAHLYHLSHDQELEVERPGNEAAINTENYCKDSHIAI